MSTEVIKVPEKKPDITIGDGGIQPRTIDELYRWGTCVIQSGFAPSTYKEASQVVVAVQWGYEIGMSPMQALQSIAVINGRPSLWGDALPALVWKSGKCSDIREWIEGDGDAMTAYCETKRAGQQNSKVTTFSVADAKRAGLWERGTWKQYPKRMLQMRARAFNFRDQFADALRGMSIAEESMDYAPTPPATPLQLSDVQIIEAGHDPIPEPKPKNTPELVGAGSKREPMTTDDFKGPDDEIPY